MDKIFVPFRARPRRGICSSALDLPHLAFRLPLFTLLVFVGCASPGQPIERKPPVPAAVTDLTAAQSGDEVVLTFSLPTETSDGRQIDHAPAIEVYRDFVQASAAAAPHAAAAATPTLVVTIPSGMVARYTQQGRIRYADTLDVADFMQHPDTAALYTVRTRLSEKKDSADSNAVVLRVYPVPDPVEDLKADVTESAIVLAWTPPQKTLAGSAPAISGYRLYRVTEPPAPAPSSAPPAEKNRPAPALIGEPGADASSFSDSNFEFGQTYTYLLRSVVQTPNGPLESGDSNSLVVTPKDIFPPAAPLGLVVTYVPAVGATRAHLELSWAISPETDVAGYNVYRSDQEGTTGIRLTGDWAQKLLLTPAFSDMKVDPGHRYFYTVTAVDRSGNESSPSAPVSGSMPAEGQTAP